MAVAVLVAFASSVLLTPLAAGVAWRVGAISHPDGNRRLQPNSTPLWGGLAVVIGVYAGVALAWSTGLIPAGDIRWTVGLMLSTGMICLLGCYDDARDISAYSKLAGQLLAIFPLLATGCYAERLLVFGYEVYLGWVGIPLTIGWLILVVNALNLLDGMDGLASLTGIVVALSIAAIAAGLGSATLILPAVLLAAALAGFLLHNFPPAKIYLGDAGSLLIGLMLAAMAMQSPAAGPTTMNGTVAAMLLLLPLADTLLAVVRRLLKQQSPFEGDRGHVHHRLLERGFTTAQVLAVLGCLSAASGCLAGIAIVFGQELLAWGIIAAGLPLLIYTRILGHEEWALLRQALATAALSWSATEGRQKTSDGTVRARLTIDDSEPESVLPLPHFHRATVPAPETDEERQAAQPVRTFRNRDGLASGTNQRRRPAA